MALKRRFWLLAAVATTVTGLMFMAMGSLDARSRRAPSVDLKPAPSLVKPMSRAELRQLKPSNFMPVHRVFTRNGKKGLTRPIVGRPVRFGVTPPLRTIKVPPGKIKGPRIVVREIPMKDFPWTNRSVGKHRPTARVQKSFPTRQTPAETLSFKAITNRDNFTTFGFVLAPPDVNGDVGRNHFVQYNNLVLEVFDKTGTTVMGPLPLSTIYSAAGFTGPCASVDDGDPVVLYDQYADRWLVTQFQVSVGPPFSMCIAVSQTGDPTGAYFLYEFVMPNDKFNDYPKFGIRPEAYYMTDNQFDVTGTTPNCIFGWCGAGAFAFDRAKLLQGDPTASFIYFDLFLLDPGIGGMLPLDLDGIAAPPTTLADGLFAYFIADEFGDPQDGLRLFDFHPDFTTPANATFTERMESPISVAAFDPSSPSSRNDVEQPGTSVGLDSISDRLLHRFVGRNMGSTTDIVVAHTVCVNPTAEDCLSLSTYHAGVRWYHLQADNTTGTISLNDQGTFAPDGDDRWMPSVAINAAGDICVIYTVSGSTTFPSVYYTCRQPGDPAGQLQMEQAFSAGAGAGSQTATNRWGDYSMMTVDPVDECTFWGTHEYYPNEGSPPSCSASGWCWETMVGTFPAPSSTSCTTPATGTIAGVVQSTETTIDLAFVDADGIYSDLSDATGAYSIILPPGTYNVTASAPGCTPMTVPVTVTAGSTTTQNFTLTCQPILEAGTPTVSGGDGDTFPDFNECFNVTIPLTNKGWVSATNVGGTLSTTTSDVAVTSSFVNYGTIAPQSSLTPMTGFSVSTSPSFGCTSVDFAFSASSAEGASVNTSFTLNPEINPTPAMSVANGTTVPIPDDGSGPATSDVTVSGFTNTLGKVTATVHITHTWDGDLVISLTNNGGTSVILSNRNGGFGQNYGMDCPADANDTTFDDDATTPISGGSAPFSGSFIPDEPLAPFAFTDPNRVWTLSVEDMFPFADTGNIECWSLNLHASSCNDGGGTCSSVILQPATLAVDDSAGNGNGVWDPGETVGPLPGWNNLGNATSSTTSLLSTTDPALTISDANGAYAIAGGTIGDCSTAANCFTASIGTTRPAQHWDVSILEELDDTVAGLVDHTWTFHIGNSFSDVGTGHVFYKAIETIFHHGITSGCGGTSYCPKQSITRGQMAAFLALAIYGSDAAIPKSGTINGTAYDCVNGPTFFTDVSTSHPFCKHIHAIAALQITKGCAANQYCPADNTTRGQMAAFLAAAMMGSSDAIPTSGTVNGSPYDCVSGPTLFTDVSTTHPFCKHIHFIFSKGITAGCSANQYCPADSTTRGQMAAFITKAFNLLLYAP